MSICFRYIHPELVSGFFSSRNMDCFTPRVLPRSRSGRVPRNDRGVILNSIQNLRSFRWIVPQFPYNHSKKHSWQIKKCIQKREKIIFSRVWSRKYFLFLKRILQENRKIVWLIWWIPYSSLSSVIPTDTMPLMGRRRWKWKPINITVVPRSPPPATKVPSSPASTLTSPLIRPAQRPSSAATLTSPATPNCAPEAPQRCLANTFVS